MSDFPKWLLALAGVSVIPSLVCPLYLFGAHPFGLSDSHFVRFLLYILTQTLWLVPLALFFVSLDQYRRGWERRGIFIAIASALIAIWGAWISFF